jgi:glycosyltransferase involved in cell wall biosynthesis
MTKLLAIPNDPTGAYERSNKDDFLSEFNPRDSNKNRYFDEVRFLNWKDEKDEEYSGIRSHSFLDDKKGAQDLIKKMSSGNIPFSSPLFKDIFAREKDRILEISKGFNPDIIRAFNSHFAAELGYMVAKELDVPLVVSAHDPSRLTDAVKYADSLVCISDDLATRAVGRHGVNPEKISVIPDGIDTERLFYPRNTEEYSSVVGEDLLDFLSVLSVGRVVPSKNIETLLKALAKVKGEVPGIKHVHLGNGSPEAMGRIEELKDSLGLGETSYFMGGIQKDELPHYYSWADVYALPTLWEGLGRAQIEALSCGTPVVTTDDTPMNTIVRDGFNGFVVDPKDPHMLANRIAKLLGNEKLRKQMGGDRARKSVKKYDIGRVMEMNCENYDKVLEK